MSEVLADLRSTLRAAVAHRALKDSQGRGNYAHDLSVVYLRLAVANQLDRGVRLTAEEVTGVIRMDTAMSDAIEEMAHDHLGHYAGEGQ